LAQTALLVTVAIVFVSAEVAARYKFPARLIAWEWFGLFVAFFVVRQLAVTPREQHGLFAVVLAGAASLAAQGIYQEWVVLPNNRQLANDPEKLRATWTEENPGQTADDSFLEQLRRRTLQNNIFGPYAHPNSYAGYLVLWLPGLIGAVVVCRRTGVPNWQTFVAAFFALVCALALWLTHSRGAMLGLLAAALGCAILVWRHRLRAHWIAVLAGTLLLAGLVYGGLRGSQLTTDTGKSSTPIAQRLGYWRTTWEMIRERPWLGVGPGNFRANYRRLMPETADEKISDPHNFALEMWATCGVFALLALLAALAAFFYQMVRSLSGGRQPPESSGAPGADAPRSEETQPIRWEYYLGGMFGLLLGFVLRATTTESPGAILEETWSALLRSVVWFAAFGLFERVVWSQRGRVLALTTGIAALLVNLCVSGGIGFPSVAGPLWIAVALALNAASLKPVAWLSRPGAAMILPLPILLGVLLAYGVYILYPVLSAYSLTHEAALSIQALHSGAIKTNKVFFVRKSVIGRLEEAARLTPDDARLYVQLAWWYGVQWSQKQRNTASSDMPIADRAIRYGQQAVALDPHGGEGYWVQYGLRTRFFAALNEQVAAKGPNRDPLFLAACEQNARQQHEEAAKTLAKYLSDDPHEVSLRYALAQAWFKAGDKEKGREQAEAARRLDEVAVLPTRKLSDPQREQIQEWLSASPSD
jgi:hypothetical protein